MRDLITIVALYHVKPGSVWEAPNGDRTQVDSNGRAVIYASNLRYYLNSGWRVPTAREAREAAEAEAQKKSASARELLKQAWRTPMPASEHDLMGKMLRLKAAQIGDLKKGLLAAIGRR